MIGKERGALLNGILSDPLLACNFFCILTHVQPARLLEKRNYDYAGSDTIGAQQTKPQTLIDAEFRLTDDISSFNPGRSRC